MPIQPSRSASSPNDAPQITLSHVVISSTPGLVIVRSFDPAVHGDSTCRGGYLKLSPGETPTIVLDGLASAAEQRDAELRYRREVSLLQQECENHDHDEALLEVPKPSSKKRRELIHYSTTVVISREHDLAHHSDPQRRGAFLLIRPGQVPEVILDGLADEAEQQDALDRCLLILEGVNQGHGALWQLATALGQEGRPALFSGGASAKSQHPQEARGQQLGERLVAARLITRTDLATALRHQAQLPSGLHRRLGSLLVGQHILSDVQVAKALGAQRGVRATSSTTTKVDPSLYGLFPAALLQEAQAAPLFVSGHTVAVAMCDPQDGHKVMLLQERTCFHVEALQATQHQVLLLLQSLPRGPQVERMRSALTDASRTPVLHNSGSTRGSSSTSSSTIKRIVLSASSNSQSGADSSRITAVSAKSGSR